MRGKVKIGDKEVEMLASAASPILYKRVFRRDWFKTLSESQEDASGIESITYFEEMAFIMASQASMPTDKLVNLTYENYLEWLGQFEAEDLMMSAGDVANLYKGQEEQSSAPKKEQG